MSPILTPSQKAASALRRAEKALRNWQDDPDSPRGDVDKMLHIVADLRAWVQGHVLADIEHAHEKLRQQARRETTPPPSEPQAAPETTDRVKG